LQELPEDWKDILEHRSKAPCIGLIISSNQQRSEINMDNFKNIVKQDFKVYDAFYKENIS